VKRAAFLYPVLVFAAAMGAGEACSNAETPASSGGDCQVTSDCQEGYVCITQTDGTRQCSNDLSSIQTTEEAGTEGAAPPMEGAAPQGDSAAPPQDSGSPPADTGAPPADTGSPPKDTGSPPQDTGSPPQDTGSPPAEAGGD
jgi:hypothetical protein